MALKSLHRPKPEPTPEPERPYMSQIVLDAVQRWAADCFLLRETCVIRDGRLDGLLIPMSWTSPMKCGLYGVEVKVSRSDFLRGLNVGQFERYMNQLNGLYVATYPDVCKTNELPRGIGHLVITRRHRIACCRRRATKRPSAMDEGMLWRILYDAFDQQRKQLRKEREVIDRVVRHICEHVGDRVVKTATHLERKYREQVSFPPAIPDFTAAEEQSQ